MLTIKTDPISDATVAIFHLAGEIDDLSDFTPISKSSAGDVTLNFAKVTGLNSFGVRKLLKLAASLHGRTVRYEDCPVVLVGQFNMISALVAEAAIVSFYLPYECRSCDLECERRVLYHETKAPGFLGRLNQSFACTKCSRQMTFMEDEEIFFHFLETCRAA